MEQGVGVGHSARAEMFHQLLETAPDAMVVVNADGVITLVNQQVERVFGYDRAELLGQPLEVLIPERLRSNHVHHRDRFIHAPSLRPMGSGLQLYARRRDGSEIPVEISLSPVQTDAGLFISASVRDVTERLKLQQAAERLKQYLLSALDSIDGSFFIWDADAKLVVCNSTARALWSDGFTGDLVGQSFQDLLEANVRSGVIDDEGQGFAALLERFLAYHENPEGTLAFRTTGGRSMRLVERRTAEGGTVALVLDVTEDEEHERALREATAAAEAANATKSEFLASMSHELRTPLNAILGFAQLLQRDKKTPLTARQQERIEHVLKGGEHLLHLIDDVLDLSRIEAGRVIISPERVDAREVLSEVEATLAPMAERANIRLLPSNLPAQLPDVRADRTRLKQILMNFGSNAIKYGRSQGWLKFTVRHTGEHVRIDVEDNGFGIPEDKHAHIFEPFQRAGQETGPIEGTGIGLAISKRLAELMAGQVGFNSVEGQGSDFWVELATFRVSETPRPRVADVVRAEDSVLSGKDGPKHLILYVEDNPSNVAFMKDLLSDFERVELRTAPTAELGIELARSERPKVVIMDINLPGMSGIEARRRLRALPETEHIPVVALSAAAMVGEAKRIAEAGFYRYLTKPVKVDALTEVLETLLGEDA